MLLPVAVLSILMHSHSIYAYGSDALCRILTILTETYNYASIVLAMSVTGFATVELLWFLFRCLYVRRILHPKTTSASALVP